MKKSTKHASMPYEALQDLGVGCSLEKWDKHKHIDISIDATKIYIEVDGDRHYTDPKQIVADFHRDDGSSNDRYHTFRVPNIMIEKHLNKIADAIKKIVEVNK